MIHLVGLLQLLSYFFVGVYGDNNNVSAANWQCLDGIAVPVHLNSNGDIECMATNGHDCLWSNDAQCRQDMNRKDGLNPLTCGAMHAKFYGSNGYDTEDHWCRKARNVLRFRCIPPRAFNDKGYQNHNFGWYDYQGQGCCNDYCRYVGNENQNWFSCALAGAATEYTGRMVVISETSMTKCGSKGANPGPFPPRGPAGPPGPPGAVGPVGPFGNPGSAGAAGSAGAPGSEGVRGAKGAPGESGEKGYQGAAAPNGAQGPIGAPGESGAPGATGPAGPIGRAPPHGAPNPAPGQQGPDGAAGATGAIGVTGSTGAGGSTGIKGAEGPKGATGPTGATGSTGPTGVGGAKGPAGANGNPGNTGASGATGPSGVNGPIGATGAAGIPGTPGTDGVVGAAGAVGATGETGVAGQSIDADVLKANALNKAELLTDEVVAKVDFPVLPADPIPTDEVLDRVIAKDLHDFSYLKMTKKVRKSLDDSELEDELDQLKSDIWRLKHRLDYAERTERKRQRAEKRYIEALLPYGAPEAPEVPEAPETPETPYAPAYN